MVDELLSFLFFSTAGFLQEKHGSIVISKSFCQSTYKSTKAEFSGGEKELYKFLIENVTYPIGARDSSICGTVFVQFFVQTDGSLSDFVVLRGVSKSIDGEALRVLMRMPNWVPACKDGLPIATIVTIPIKFRLV